MVHTSLLILNIWSEIKFEGETMKHRPICCLLTLVLLLFSATAVLASADAPLKGSGATFPQPLYDKWFKEYTAIDPGVSFKYYGIGSGGGIKAIMSESVDFGATDKFLSDDELKGAPAQLLHIPTVMGAVAITYNLPGIRSGLRLTPDILAKIYLGTISRWNDPAIVRQNPKLALPNQPIVVLHREDSSGTTNIFTGYLSQVSTSWAKTLGVGTTVAWPVGKGAKGSGGMSLLIKDNPFSIGYLEVAYALENSLAIAMLRNRSGVFVKPTALATRAAAVSALNMDRGGDCRISLVNEPGRDAYPIVGLTWLLVYKKQKNAVTGKKLVEFLLWELRKAEKMTSTLYFTPLPKELADKAEKTIKSISYQD
jgi:phosphate transport system substrate-binding protein